MLSFRSPKPENAFNSIESKTCLNLDLLFVFEVINEILVDLAV